MNCVFCNIIKDNKEILFESDLCVAFYDGCPVNKGHTLIIPKRHCETYFDLTENEIQDMFRLSQKVKAHLDEQYHPDGYNVGFNCKEAGGQTIMHAHMHVIPRYIGDVENPRGGVRKAVGRKKF